MKLFKLCLLIITSAFFDQTADAQKLIDLSKTDEMISHDYPHFKPSEVVLLNVKKVVDKEDIEFDSYINIQVLRIEFCELDNIDIDFNKYPNLQSIYIGGSSFKEINFHGTPMHLIDIMLYDRHFENYDFLSNFSSLESVCVSDSMELPIDNLCQNLLKLPKLNSIYIAYGKLKRLPETFKQFKKLDWLSLTYMDPTFDLAHTFDLIKDVEINNLNLMGCNVEILPPNVNLLKKIKTFGIVNSSFKTLPEEIGELTQLEEIQASMSSLDSVPLSLAKLTNLRELGLMPCEFKTIPVVLYKMTWLKMLDIGANEWFPTDAELKPLRKKLKGCKVNDF